MNKFILAIFILIIIILGFWFIYPRGISEPEIDQQQYLIINGQKIWVELAQTDQQRVKGLSGREKLAEDQGMLFIFPQAGNYGFWMKEMKFDLDFVFINNKQVVDLAENITYPKSSQTPQTVRSKAQFNSVLEINAGGIKNYNIKIGDNVTLNN